LSFLNELKRRNVLRVAAAYVVSAWLVIQVVETIFPAFGFGDAAVRIVTIVFAIGLIPTLIFAWAFELTPEGLKKESEVDRSQSITPYTGKKLDRMIMVVLALALGYFAFDKFVLNPQRVADIAKTAAEAGKERAREEARLEMFDEKSVAVLPFANRSEKKEDEYFTDGMHDEILTRLSRIASLKVISRTSVMNYRGTDKSIPEIARELSVATILEGGVQRSGNHVRINVQLIDAHTDEHLWAEIYDRELSAENLFAIQSEISTEIAKSLQATLSPEEKSRVYDLPTRNLEAYKHFLRGRQLMASRNTSDMEEALAEFKKATELDPDFALAWVGVADSVHLLDEAGAYDKLEHHKVHREAVEKALALNDQLGEVYTSLAFSYAERPGEMIERYEKMQAAFIKALELNPNYAQTYIWYANTYVGADRKEKRLQLLYKAAQLDPLSSIIQINLAGALQEVGKLAESRQVVEEILQRDPEFAFAYQFLGGIEIDKGQLAQAVQWYRKAISSDPQNGQILLNLAFIYLALGDYETVAAIREVMDDALGSDNLTGKRADYFTAIARSDWQEGIDLLGRFPEEMQNHWMVLAGYYFLYTYSGELHKANEYLLKWRPYLADRATWQREVTDAGEYDCEFAYVMIMAGDETLGRDLLEVYMKNVEAISSSGNAQPGELINIAMCHALNGSTDKAIGILESEVDKGHAIDWWWQWGKSPAWIPFEDSPRFTALVSKIEEKLARQRELLGEMEGSDGVVR